MITIDPACGQFAAQFTDLHDALGGDMTVAAGHTGHNGIPGDFAHITWAPGPGRSYMERIEKAPFQGGPPIEESIANCRHTFEYNAGQHEAMVAGLPDEIGELERLIEAKKGILAAAGKS